MKLHILRDGQELGALPVTEARELVAIGFLRTSDEFWMDDPRKLQTLEKLF